MSRHFIVLDIGGTRVRAALINYQGGIVRMISRVSMENWNRNWEALSASISRLVSNARRGTTEKIEGVGVALPGGINSYDGTVVLPPVICPDIPRDIVRALRELLQPVVGDAPVRVGNDATCAAIGEWRFSGHVERGVRDLVYVTVSTGIGCGIIQDGKPFWGTGGLAAEFGHVPVDYRADAARLCGCGRRGCLEAYASGTGIVKSAIEAKVVDQSRDILSAECVDQRADNGEAPCAQIIIEAATTLGTALAGLVHLLNPRLLVLGGGVALGSNRFRETAIQVMRARVMSPAYINKLKVSTAVQGDDAGLYGALLLAAYEEELKPIVD